MATEPSKWNIAPGTNADCNDIPDTADADSGLASWSALFPQLTALPLSAGGRAPKREDFNGLLRAFGQWVFYYMQGGVPSWERGIAYTAGSFARHNGTTWTALKGSRGVIPAEGEYWHALSNFYTSGSLVSDLLNRVYPVGSIYMSAVNVSPASFLGGTWQAIEQGRMLMAAGSSWQAGTTGGAAYHALTVQEMPAHDTPRQRRRLAGTLTGRLPARQEHMRTRAALTMPVTTITPERPTVPGATHTHAAR